MGTGEGGRRRRRLDGDDDDDEYVLEEEEGEEEYEEELSASSGGEGGEGSDSEYGENEEGETQRPKRPMKGGDRACKGRTNPAAARSRQRRYEDDDYLEEIEEDEEIDDYQEDEEAAPRPKRITKCGGRGQKGKLSPAAEGCNWRRHEEEDMDFDPDLDEEEEEEDMDFDPEEEDMDFDPEVEDDEDEEEEELDVSHTRKVRIKNIVRLKPASKHRQRKKKNSSSKVSRRKVDSAKSRKAAPVRRRRKRSVIDHYEEDEGFIVEDEDEVNRQSSKKARVGRQMVVDHPVPGVEEDTWPTVDSDTSDFDFVTSDEEPEDVERVVVEPVRVTVRKGRKKRISGLESSSDSEFHVSDKELRDFRETGPLEAQPVLPASPRNISVTKNGEDKGKEKKEPEEVGRLTCGICLSEEQRMTMQGVLNCCSHYFCFACIMEWSRVESRCPLCKRRFTTITKSSKVDHGLELIKSVIRVAERDQVCQPTEDEIRRWLDPYENVVCIECNQGGHDSLMLLCDICDSSAHTYCVGLGREVPEGSWYCGGCRVSGEGPSYPRSPVNRNSEEFAAFEMSPSRNTRQTFQGIDINVSPREIPGENLPAESQASTVGVATPSGRLAAYSRTRQINEWISILLSRPRPMISPDMGHSGAQHNGSVPRTEPNHRNFRILSETNASQHSGSVPRTEPNHRNFEATSEANISQTLARRCRNNEWTSTLLPRTRTMISPEVGHSGDHSGSVPRTEPNHRNFHASVEANTSQLSGSVPRTEPNHGDFGATSDANTSQTISTSDADLFRMRQINGYIDILLSRPRSTNNPDGGNNGVQDMGSVPGTEPNRNFRAPSEGNT